MTSVTAPALPIKDSGFFVLRTPLLPIDELREWSAGLIAHDVWLRGAEARTVQVAWRADVDGLRARLRVIAGRPEVQHALYLASTSLHAALQYWLRDPDSKKGVQAERALVRYFARMSARCTPFGVFSGCSVGRIDHAAPTTLQLSSRAEYRLSSRLDFDYLFELTTALRADEALLGQLRYWPNTSLRRHATEWRYTELRVNGSRRSHHFVKLADDNYLSAAMERASSGATVAELAAAVLAASGDEPPSAEERLGYVMELVRNDVLVPYLTPLLTGQPALDDLVDQLDGLPAGKPIARTLSEIKVKLRTMDEMGVLRNVTEYEDVAETLRALPGTVDPARMCQVDMVKPVREAVLGAEVIEELRRAVEVLCRLGRTVEPKELTSFKEAFVERYERAMVPLVEALDEDSGIGFGRATGPDIAPLLRGIRLTPRSAADAARTEFNALLMRRLISQPTLAELALDLSDLPSAPDLHDRLPSSFCIIATIVAPSPAAVADGDFALYVKGGTGPGGALLFGRFCHADQELDNHVRRHIAEEEALDRRPVYAEVVHAPEGRVGNVLCRPVLRDYEIVYLARSGAPPDRQLPITDLMVSVHDRKVVLYSRRLRRHVVPRLTNAHGFMNTQLASIYRFLCCLQRQEPFAIPGFSWPLEDLDHVPRVRVGRLVMGLESWRLKQADIAPLQQSSGSARFIAVQELRRARALPRWVVLQQDDHTLPVDLDNALSVDALVHVLQRSTAATLTEMYPSPDGTCVMGPEGQFCHEINVPFVRSPIVAESPNPYPRVPHEISRHQRLFVPGSEWIYLKLYGSMSVAETILLEGIAPLASRLLRDGAICRWFFVRYSDPHEHLRVRFNASGPAAADVLARMHEILGRALGQGQLWRIQHDTYQREVERYGGIDAMLLAEDMFSADSDCVVTLLKVLEGDGGEDMRWRLTCVGIDRLMSDMGLDLESKQHWLLRWRDTFEREFAIGATERRQLAEIFRAERNRMQATLADTSGPEYETVQAALKRRSDAIAPVVRRLRELEERGVLSASWPELASHHVHMHVNRMIRSSVRQHEFVLYDLLSRAYQGALARRRVVQNQ